MHTLTIKLKQHTPLIHFQHDQDGATLRASEVKPKLDKYLLSAIGEDYYNVITEDEFEDVATHFEKKHPGIPFDDALGWDKQVYEVGKYIAKKNSWFVNKDDSVIALNYRIRIWDDGEKYYHRVSIINAEKCVVYNKTIYIDIFCQNDLLGYLKQSIASFFAVNNFGFRQSKGYGSFSVETIEENGILLSEDIIRINQLETLKKYYAHVSAFTLNSRDGILINLNDYFQRKVVLSKEDKNDYEKKKQLRKATTLSINIDKTTFNSHFVFTDYKNRIESCIKDRFQEIKRHLFLGITDYENAIIEGLSGCLSNLPLINNDFQYAFFKEVLEQQIVDKYQLYKSGKN